jgi:hypothetical protein
VTWPLGTPGSFYPAQFPAAAAKLSLSGSALIRFPSSPWEDELVLTLIQLLILFLPTMIPGAAEWTVPGLWTESRDLS